MKGWKRWAFPLLVIGANSIAIYVMSWTIEHFVSSALVRHLGTAPFLDPGPAVRAGPARARRADRLLADPLLDVPAEDLPEDLTTIGVGKVSNLHAIKTARVAVIPNGRANVADVETSAGARRRLREHGRQPCPRVPQDGRLRDRRPRQPRSGVARQHQQGTRWTSRVLGLLPGARVHDARRRQHQHVSGDALRVRQGGARGRLPRVLREAAGRDRRRRRRRWWTSRAPAIGSW